MSENGNFYNSGRQHHNHARDADYLQYVRLKKTIIAEAKRTTQPLKVIFDRHRSE